MSSKKNKGIEAMKMLKQTNKGKTLANLMEELKMVDVKSDQAKKNETSMKDSRGREIIYTLTEDMIGLKNKKK